MRYSAAFFHATQLFAAAFGTPLPKHTIQLGNPDRGWFLRLNPTDTVSQTIPPFSILVDWNGFPAGIIDAGGGVIAAGELANEDTLLEWLGAELKQRNVEPIT